MLATLLTGVLPTLLLTTLLTGLVLTALLLLANLLTTPVLLAALIVLVLVVLIWKRAGVTGHNVRYVLLISTLAVIALCGGLQHARRAHTRGAH